MNTLVNFVSAVILFFSSLPGLGVDWDGLNFLRADFDIPAVVNSGGRVRISVGQPRMRLKDPLPPECVALLNAKQATSASREAYLRTYCWEPVPPSPEELGELAAEAFAVMPIDAGVMGVQPAAETVLVNKETIVYSQAQTQTMGADLLGTQVILRAKPVLYTWRFADGAVIETKDPGAPYPNQRVWHKYQRTTPDGATEHISLDISWAGAYSTDAGASWNFIPGRGHTSQASHEFRVVEMRSRLIKR